MVLTNYQEEISSHLFDAVDWQYPDTLFNEWIDSDEINLVGNKYIFTAGMELNDFLKMEYLKDFDYGLVTGTIYGYPDKELRLSESFEIWGKDGEYFGAYSKKDVMTKLDGLDAKQQEKTQSIDEEKDLELDEFEK